MPLPLRHHPNFWRVCRKFWYYHLDRRHQTRLC